MSREVPEKVRQTKTKEEARNILSQNGIVLSDEELEGVAGGLSPTVYEKDDDTCPYDK